MSFDGEGSSQEYGRIYFDSSRSKITCSKETDSIKSVDWAILELNESVLLLPFLTVVEELRDRIGVPIEFYSKSIMPTGEFDRRSPLSNYLFVRTDQPESKLLKLEAIKFVDNVLCIPGSLGRWRTVSKISTPELEELGKGKIYQELSINQNVHIINGPWSGMDGLVYEVFGDKVKILLDLRSRKRIVTVEINDVQ